MRHVLPHTAASAAAARRLLREDLRRAGVAPAVVDDASLVLSELVGNAVRHGTAMPCTSLTVGWSLRDDALRVEVQDGGAGPLRRGPRDSGAGSLDGDEDGRGLTIVGLLCTGWGVTDTDRGAVVWAELALARARESGTDDASYAGEAGSAA